MARIRTVKPEFFQHHDLFKAEKETSLPLRLAFIGLWTVADREGRFKWRPIPLKVSCLPYDEVDFAPILNTLEKHGFIKKYKVDSEDFGFIPSWKKHQNVNHREQSSTLPDPRVDVLVNLSPDLAGGEGKGKEGKGREGVQLISFAAFWVEYPRKVAKQAAWRAWQKINPDEEMTKQITQAVAVQKSHADWMRGEARFIPHPATWLNGGRWEDQTSVQRVQAPKPTYPRCSVCGDELRVASSRSDCCGQIFCFPCVVKHDNREHPKSPEATP